MRTQAAVLAIWALCVSACPSLAQEGRPNRVTINYGEPSDARHRPLLKVLQERDALEKMQSILSPIRLPRPLALQTKSCDGEVNAWYESDAITLCYEYLEWIWEVAHKAQRALPVSGEGALMGPFVELVVHEAGHAIFDYLKIPIMGREEDAADQMAALWILTFGQSRAADLLAGIVNLYLDDAGYRNLRQLRRSRLHFTRGTAQADEHSTALQRMYNVLCLAYGSDPASFSELKDKGFLPADRAEGCESEYAQVVHAYRTLIQPHVDAEIAQQTYGSKWPPARR
jgi:hypothetical protein